MIRIQCRMRRLAPIICSFLLLASFAASQTKPASNLVYAVEKGKAYHKKNCKLKVGSKGMTLVAAKKKGYKACKVCKPPQ